MNISEDILFYAFRYALGRMTYAVNDVAQAIIQNASNLHHSTRNLMAKEIREAIHDGHAGMDMDIKQWNQVLAELNKRETHETEED